jgi:hypothetical protein
MSVRAVGLLRIPAATTIALTRTMAATTTEPECHCIGEGCEGLGVDGAAEFAGGEAIGE